VGSTRLQQQPLQRASYSSTTWAQDRKQKMPKSPAERTPTCFAYCATAVSDYLAYAVIYSFTNCVPLAMRHY
jgi:hypothetical protein